MNEHQIKGAVGDMAGRVQSAAGALSDDPAVEIKGKARETVGKLEGAYGDGQAMISGAAATLTRAIQVKPIVSVLIAGAVGCALGWVLSRD